MRTAFALVAVALATTVFACSSAPEDSDSAAADGNVDQGDEQDITSTKNQLKGSWDVSAASKDLTSVVSYEFNANGTFSREVNRILNGVLLPGSPRPTENQKGRYTINASKHLVTLHITSPREMTETLAYEYKPGRVLNGVFLPGHEPSNRPTLTLTQQAAPRSHVAFPSIVYNQAVDVGGDGATCGGFVGLPCAPGYHCVAAAACCDLPGRCVKDSGPPPGALGLPIHP